MGSRRLSLLAAALVLGACSGNNNQPDVPVTVDFNHTGCGREVVKSADDTPTLTLEYTESGLLITRTNALLNCSINNGGITCKITAENGVISYHAYETDDTFLKCLCPVAKMTALVHGLKENVEYTLQYKCDGKYRPITFYYAKGLKVTFDLSLYLVEE